MQIIVDVEGQRVVYTCHEHKILQISASVRNYRQRQEDEVIALNPQDKVPTLKAQAIHHFLHWLYNNRFTEPEQGNCSFGQLLDLYFLGHAYEITVLKNVVIDHLIEKCSTYSIPDRCTKRIYKYTKKGDQLRRLWVDVYVWEVPEEQFRTELESGKLDPTFLQDLAMAQMHKIRARQRKSGPGIPPYEKSKSVYHKRDSDTGVCCRRKEYEGLGFHHRGNYEQENASLRSKLEKLQSKLEVLKREESEYTSVKRNLQKMQLKLSKMEMRVKRHVSIDHSKLFKSSTWDNPEIMHKELLRNAKDPGGAARSN